MCFIQLYVAIPFHRDFLELWPLCEFLMDELLLTIWREESEQISIRMGNYTIWILMWILSLTHYCEGKDLHPYCDVGGESKSLQ